MPKGLVPAPSRAGSWSASAVLRHGLALAIGLLLLYVALLPSPPLPHAVHHLTHLFVGTPSAGKGSGPALLANILRKLPEAFLYFLLALLLARRDGRRFWVFLAVGCYGLGLELLRPLHAGRAFEPFDVLYEAIAALIGAYLPSLPWWRHASVRPD